MNNCMPPFAADEPARTERRLVAEEAPGWQPPTIWRVLGAVYAARLHRAANHLARAKHDARRARVQQCRAESEAARLQERADALERERHREWGYRELQGRDIHSARGARMELETRLAKRAEDARACAHTTAERRQMRSEAERRYRTVARKEAKFRVLLERLDAAGHE